MNIFPNLRGSTIYDDHIAPKALSYSTTIDLYKRYAAAARDHLDIGHKCGFKLALYIIKEYHPSETDIGCSVQFLCAFFDDFLIIEPDFDCFRRNRERKLYGIIVE